MKLSDFGLSTNEVESADVGCGSTPYMSYGEFFFVLEEEGVLGIGLMCDFLRV